MRLRRLVAFVKAQRALARTLRLCTLSAPLPVVIAGLLPSSATAGTVTLNSIGEGRDTCQDPTQQAMRTWWEHTAFRFWGMYVGGDSTSCSQPNLSKSYLTNVTDGAHQQWDLNFFWVGNQAPCSGYSYRFSYNTTEAFNEGYNAAYYADKTVYNLGLYYSVPLSYDLEELNSGNGSCVSASQSYVSGWDVLVAKDAGRTPGVYGSSCGPDLTAFASTKTVPYYIHGVDYNNNESPTNLECVPSGYWVYKQRLKQYRGGHLEEYGGVRLEVDSDSAEGPVYAWPPEA